MEVQTNLPSMLSEKGQAASMMQMKRIQQGTVQTWWQNLRIQCKNLKTSDRLETRILVTEAVYDWDAYARNNPAPMHTDLKEQSGLYQESRLFGQTENSSHLQIQ